ncbi:hypothetical protein FLL45_07730 [Aliikangiella marina]|uniref:Endonuclease n=1 Tax=Aliikangiella marina TaxID=1712262 RepID=A0A545TCC3_9GAMM|nr:endonuclease/exonuclease/phosphatase family protein [Aliikangiella marina]TQV74841.1 hypothetical protein FLL45_07730 [Aliikangiella marina]
MVPHGQETPPFKYSLAVERRALQASKLHRQIPNKSSRKMLAATWNLTNFGVQQRLRKDIQLIAEVIGWFDLIAIQEVADDLTDLRTLLRYLPNYKVILSDIGGNEERTGFLYDSKKIQRLELAAEVAVPPSDHRYIRMRGASGSFKGFDRNPYAVAFKAGRLEFIAVSVHLYFGSHSYFDEDRRALEAYALARWADRRKKTPESYSNNVLLLGDFNLPSMEEKGNVYKALASKGLILPKYSTQLMGSNLKGDMHYDQVAFHAGRMKNYFTGNSGVFDFDRAPFFGKAWDNRLSKEENHYFRQAIKFHISDHRPLWSEFSI